MVLMMGSSSMFMVSMGRKYSWTDVFLRNMRWFGSRKRVFSWLGSLVSCADIVLSLM